MSKRKVMCRDGVTECPEPEHTGCTHNRKLCDDGADQEGEVSPNGSVGGTVPRQEEEA